MAKPYTHVEVFYHFDKNSKGRLELSGEAINKIRLESLRKAGSNWDDGDVIFRMNEYPVWEMEPENGIDREEWIAKNVLGMDALREAIFSTRMFDDMSEKELCEMIKQSNGCSNSEAFEISSKIREGKHVPATHILWAFKWNECPEYLRVYMMLHNNAVKDLVEKTDMDDNTTMILLDECDRKYKPEEYLSKSKAEVLKLGADGKARLF